MSELQRLGSEISLRDHTAVIKGVEQLSGAPVMASDLRAGAALCIAGFSAEGKTEVSRIYHMDRGYEDFDVKIRSLGGIINRIIEEGPSPE